MTNSRIKGQDAEREVIRIILPVVRGVLGPDAVLSRNLEQYQRGGHDIVGIDWLALEVKRQEELQIEAWWRQTLAQASSTMVPVLAFRQSRKPWRVMMCGYLREEVQCRVEVTMDDFLLYLKHELLARSKT